MEGTYNLLGEVKIHIDHIQTQDLQERLIAQLLDIQLIAQIKACGGITPSVDELTQTRACRRYAIASCIAANVSA